jgi:Ca2+-binding RTX toxin-like protein
VGSGGSDALIGGSGADNFLYVVASDSTIASHDTITDFNHSQGDTIDFTNIAGAHFAQGMSPDQATSLAADSVGWMEDTVSTYHDGCRRGARLGTNGIVLNGVNLGLMANDFHLI